MIFGIGISSLAAEGISGAMRLELDVDWRVLTTFFFLGDSWAILVGSLQ